jgi:hypothetical protein
LLVYEEEALWVVGRNRYHSYENTRTSEDLKLHKSLLFMDNHRKYFLRRPYYADYDIAIAIQINLDIGTMGQEEAATIFEPLSVGLQR